MNWHETTALFGGTFDPPHLGHLQAVQGLFASPGVRRVMLVPTVSPGHKPAIAPAQDRIEMARLLSEAASRSGEVLLDDREIRLFKANPSRPTFSFYLIEEIRREVRDLAFVIGTDQLKSLPTWHRFPEILGLCHWIVLVRRPHSPDETLEAAARLEKTGLLAREATPSGHFGSWRIKPGSMAGVSSPSQPRFLTVVPTSAVALSSTEIREAIARTGTPPAESLQIDIEAYLKRRRIYGTKAGESRH